MKKSILFLLLGICLTSCKKEGTTGANVTASDTTDVTKETTNKIDVPFNINAVRITKKDLGTFPYLTPPPEYSYNYHQEADPKNIKNPDKEYFAINGKLLPKEGKSFKINIERESADTQKFNALEVQNFYEKKIKELDGIQVNNIAISKEEYKRVGETELIDNFYGYSINPNLLDRVKTFLIRTTDKNVWIQFSLLDNESGNMTILEEEAVK
jgi:hypothetical protein